MNSVYDSIRPYINSISGPPAFNEPIKKSPIKRPPRPSPNPPRRSGNYW